MTNKTIIDKNWYQNPDVTRLFNIFHKENFEIRIVGGAIRNYLMKLSIKDIDFATSAIPSKTIEILHKYHIKTQSLAKEHGTISAIIKDKEYQITTIRKDVLTDGRKAVVQFGINWEEDAQRRDFTFNAIYADQNAALYDYTGSSLKDCYEKNIVFVGEAEKRIKEDFLRAFRYFRFLGLYTDKKADPNIIKIIKKVQNGFNILSAERIKKEMTQIINVKPHKLIHILKDMQECGIFEKSKIKTINPDFQKICTNQVFQKNNDDMLKFNMIFGENIAKRLNFSKKETQISKNINLGINLGVNLGINIAAKIKKEKIFFKYIAKYGCHNTKYIALGAAAKINEQKIYNKIYRNIKKISDKKFPINATELIEFGYQEGPKLGKIIEKLYLKWMLSQAKMTKTQLIKEISIKSKNFSYRKKNQKINTIIIHSIKYDFLTAAKILTDTKAKHKVSAHYLIDIDGHVAKLVPNSKKAWHAGKSNWAGINDINQNSIGIELVNQQQKFENKQINALINIISQITQKYQIEKHNILAHQDIAVGRKFDPGIFFPWKKLAKQKIVPKYQNTSPSKVEWQQIFKQEPKYFNAAQLLLKLYGYHITQQNDEIYCAMKAFETRFCGDYIIKSKIPDVGKKLAQIVKKRDDIYKNNDALNAIKYLKNYQNHLKCQKAAD